MRQNKSEIPVYLFMGFLEAGKTGSIQRALEDPEFNDGKKTLLLLCEEGIDEYQPTKFASKNVTIEKIFSKEELIRENLYMLAKRARAEQVLIEYNGMWMLNDLAREMPRDWIVYQVLTLVDASSILMYNKNMRNLVYDKMKSTDMVVFNRFEQGMDKMEYHKMVRAASRSAEIIYEYADDFVELDDIEDPLPFDLEADVIKIRDIDYAIWYRDLCEDISRYEGKIVEFKGRILMEPVLDEGSFALTRRVMTCCEEDIELTGFVVKSRSYKSENYKSEKGDNKNYEPKHDDWAIIKAEVSQESCTVYGREVHALQAIEIKKAAPPVEEVATFF